MKFIEGHELFIEYVHAKGYAPGTITAYQQDARSFLRFMEDKGIDQAVKSLDGKTLRKYTIWLAGQNYAPSTIGRRLDSLSSCFRYLQADEYIDRNPMANVDRPLIPDRIPEYLSRQEVDRLLYAVDHTPGYFQLRDQAILRVLIYCGLRRSEVFALDWRKVDFKSNLIKVVQAKGRKDRLVPMNLEVQEHLWRYLQSRLPLQRQMVFTNRHKNRMDADTIGRIITKYIWKARIDKEVTPHTLRHTCATLLIEAGVDIVTVKELLGHRDINSTLIYTHTTPTRLSEAVRLLDPKPKEK